MEELGHWRMCLKGYWDLVLLSVLSHLSPFPLFSWLPLVENLCCVMPSLPHVLPLHAPRRVEPADDGQKPLKP